MITADDMRDAIDEAQVYRLLTGYVDAARAQDELNCLPQPMTQLPLDGIADVRERVAKLIGEVDVASRRWDHNACRAIKQAVYVFATALSRLETLKRNRILAGHRRP
jgi:hypothetical protein